MLDGSPPFVLHVSCYSCWLRVDEWRTVLAYAFEYLRTARQGWFSAWMGSDISTMMLHRDWQGCFGMFLTV